MSNSDPVLGLVLTGGGARAAYQAGVLKAISELHGPGPIPFRILAGVSAGAINATFLASRADDFERGTRELWRLWAELKPENVFRTDSRSLGKTSLRWIAGLSSGRLALGGRINYLLETSPLRELLSENIDFGALRAHVASGLLRGFAVSATNYGTGTALSFFDGHPGIEPWLRSTRLGVRQEPGLEHVMASAAIPIFFPPVSLNGAFFGDGCIRLSTPLSPAIHLGADRVLAIGIRYQRSERMTAELNQQHRAENPAMADIAGVLLNAVFLDSLETDLERMERINRTVQLIPASVRGSKSYPLRHVPVHAIRPSMDLGTLASERFNNFAGPVRFLLQGIGASRESGSDLLSYLGFDRSFTLPLLELGYTDAMGARQELEAFLRPPAVLRRAA